MPGSLLPSQKFKILIAWIAKEISQEVNPYLEAEDTEDEFRCYNPPDATLANYLKVFADHCHLEEVNLITIFILFRRFTTIQSEYFITNYNIHLLLTAIIIAEQKINNDFAFENKEFNVIGGWLEIGLVNKAERGLYKLLSWNLSIQPELYDKYKERADYSMHLPSDFTSNTGLEMVKFEHCFEAFSIDNDTEGLLSEKEASGGDQNINSTDIIRTPLNTRSFLSPSSNAYSIFSMDDEKKPDPSFGFFR